VPSKTVFLKPRGAVEPVPWEEIAVDAPEVGSRTRLEDAQFVALDVETTGNAPFLVLEIGAERFTLAGPLSFFDTLVDCRAPINPYARRRHHIERSMLIGAPEFRDARRAFLRNEPLELAAREWAVLEVLLAKVEKIVSKEAIIQAVAGWGDDLSPNAIEVYVSRLRSKLEPAGIKIRTVRGFGYMLEEFKGT